MPKYKSKYREDDDNPELYEDPPLQIVPRREWTQEEAKSETGPLANPCYDVVVTHTETEPCIDRTSCVQRIQEVYGSHREKGLVDIAPNFLIGEDGSVYEGRGWKLKPYPLRRIHNNPTCDEFLQIAFIGTFGDGNGEHRRPTMELCYGLQDLVNYGMDNGFLEQGTIPPPESKLPIPTRRTDVDVTQFD